MAVAAKREPVEEAEAATVVVVVVVRAEDTLVRAARGTVPKLVVVPGRGAFTLLTLTQALSLSCAATVVAVGVAEVVAVVVGALQHLNPPVESIMRVAHDLWQSVLQCGQFNPDATAPLQAGQILFSAMLTHTHTDKQQQ